MSTLDQAFIRAYNKDRRTAANTTNNAAPADNTNRVNPSATNNAAPVHATTQSAGSTPTTGSTPATAAHDEVAQTETGRWYRVDAAGNLHTRHQRMGDTSEQTHVEPQTLPAGQSNTETVRTETNSGNIQSRHAGHRLPPYPHMNNGLASETAETVSVGATNNGRRTLASYLAQNQTPAVPEVLMEDINDAPVQPTAASKTITNFADSSTRAMPAQPAKGNVRVDQTSTPAPASFRATAPAAASSAPVASAASSAVATSGTSAPARQPSTTHDEGRPARTISQEAARSTLKMPAVGHFRTTRTDRPAVQETETAKTKFAAVPFQSAWEVDSFEWPEIQSKLLAEQDRAFAKVAAHFADACRQGLQVLVVTSPTEKEGRSTVASCIARSVAQRGIQVAFLEGDIESPSLADSLNLDIAQGWSDAIVEGLPLEEVAIHSIEDKLTFIPLTAGPTAPKLAHFDRYIAAVLERLRESFDLIVIDATFINSLDNRLIGTEEHETIDAMILVTDGRNEDQQRIENSIRRIKNLGISSVGIVENFTTT